MEKILLTQAIGGLCPQRRNCKIASASVMAIRLYFFFFFLVEYPGSLQIYVGVFNSWNLAMIRFHFIDENEEHCSEHSCFLDFSGGSHFAVIGLTTHK